MTRTTHTPGPWNTTANWKTGDLTIISADCLSQGVIGTVNVSRNNGADYAANARLIAAAPEMAIEIKKQIDWLKHARTECAGAVRGSLLNGFDQSIKYLTAVLAKATGEKI